MTHPLSWDNPADRVRAVFGLPAEAPLPRVDADTLLVFRQHLADQWPGRPQAGVYCEPGRFQREQIWLCGVGDGVDESRGVCGEIAGDSLAGEYPLSRVTLDADAEWNETLADYQFWYAQGQTPLDHATAWGVDAVAPGG